MNSTEQAIHLEWELALVRKFGGLERLLLEYHLYLDTNKIDVIGKNGLYLSQKKISELAKEFTRSNLSELVGFPE